MAKYWYSYTKTDPNDANAPARNQSSNYVYIKTPLACGATDYPCTILATGSAGTPTTGSHPVGTTISSNLQSYFSSAIGTYNKYPQATPSFVYLKA